jgi:amidase
MKQLSRLNRIVALKGLGFTLQQVQSILDDKVSAEELRGMLRLTIKEGFNVAGLHTTWGNPAFKDFVADSDATVVRRLEQAGAIIIGKTNLHFMLADFGQTANELYGVTNNPWDTTRTPGGLPVGAQIVGPLYEDDTAITFAELLGDVIGGYEPPPV